MSAKAPVCPQCGRRWPERGARFCGCCGASLLLPTARTSARREPTMGRAARAAVAFGVLAIIGVAIASLDLTGPTYDSPVAFDDRSQPEGAPLSESEAAALREQADPHRLRCEPRGCELWRLDRDELSAGHGIVALDDGLLLTVGGRGTVSTMTFNLDGEEVEQVLQHGHVLRALDPETGEEAWKRILATAPGSSDTTGADRTDEAAVGDADDNAGGGDAGGGDAGGGDAGGDDADDPSEDDADDPTEDDAVDVPSSDGYDWLQLLPGPAGPLAATNKVVVSLDGQGEERWRWQAPRDGPFPEWWPTAIGEDVLVLRAVDFPSVGDPHGELIVLDADTGDRLWAREAYEVVLSGDIVLVSDDGTTAALDVRTGAVLWERPDERPGWMAGGPEPWVITHADDGARLVDPETGEQLAMVDGGWFNTVLTPVGDLWIGVVRDGAIEDHAGSDIATLVGIAQDGSPVWFTDIDDLTRTERSNCCHLGEDGTTGDVRVTLPTGAVRIYDRTDGERLAERPEDVAGDAPPGGNHTWHPEPGVAVTSRFDGSRMEIRTEEGVVRVTGQHTSLESVTPLIVSDERHIIGIQVPPGS